MTHTHSDTVCVLFCYYLTKPQYQWQGHNVATYLAKAPSAVSNPSYINLQGRRSTAESHT